MKRRVDIDRIAKGLGDGQAILHGRGQLVHREHEAAVAQHGDDGAMGLSDLSREARLGVYRSSLLKNTAGRSKRDRC